MNTTTKLDEINPDYYVLNCVPSVNCESDWTFSDAVNARLMEDKADIPANKDLRESWWEVDDQKNTGACVGYATAYGVLRWIYTKRGLISKSEKPSARFIWMANKETDNLNRYPTTFLETAGTQTKLALRVAQKFGCVNEELLPMSGLRCDQRAAVFYAQASRYRISSYHNLGRNINDWKAWIALNGPILARLDVDENWFRATENHGVLKTYLPETVRGGHAVCLVGYTDEYFIVRNSWGESWGDRGFAYASHNYAKEAFTEAFGAIL